MQTPLRLFPHEDETIEGVGAALRAGKTTCASVLEHCFHQIDLWDEKVRAWVVVDRAGAMHQARALDGELSAGRCRGPLHGIPIGIKDIIDVKGLPTAAGFKPWRERVAAEDALVVASLRRGGAVILGKTVTTQFAWIDPPVTRNPWNLDRTPGGSSSGSAAAVATGMCLGAIGTQTGGSIIRPASFCGVAGFKPSYNEFVFQGIVPFSSSLDHPGPIARTVRDLALCYYELPNADLYDLRDRPDCEVPFTVGEVEERASRWFILPDLAPELLRPRGYFDRRAEPGMLETFERALATLVEAGAEIHEMPDDGYDFEGLLTEHRTIMAAEAATSREADYAGHPGEFAPHILALIEEGLATPLTRYVKAQHRWRGASLRTSRLHPNTSVSIVTPATVGPAPDLTTTGNPCMNSPWSYLGWDTVSFPVGLSAEGLPLAIQLTCPGGSYPFLEIAAWCEGVLRRAFLAGNQ